MQSSAAVVLFTNITLTDHAHLAHAWWASNNDVLPVRESQKRHGIAQRMLRGVSTNLYQISCSPLLFNAFICGRDGERGVLKPFSDMDYCNVALATRRPAKLRPGYTWARLHSLSCLVLSCAVRHQRCRTPDSWRAAPWPHHSAPWWPPLAADASAHSVQAAYVRTGCVHGSAPSYLQNAICPGLERGMTASPAQRVIGRSHRAGDATLNNGRPRLRRTACLNSLPDAIRRSSSLTILVFHHPSHFHSRLKPSFFLQILPTVAFLFFFSTDYMDSPDCLILLSISVFLLFSVFHFLVVDSVR